MKGDSTGALLKLARAEEHLATINDEVRQYVESRPYRRIREYHPTHGEVTRGLRITDEPSAYVSTQIGDFLHNVRSFLDHIAWNLVIANGGMPTRRTYFPIWTRANMKNGQVDHVRISGGVDSRALALIDELQPYHAGNSGIDYPLRVLASLSNIDKHRRLLLTGAWIEKADYFRGRIPGIPDDIASIFLIANPSPDLDEHWYAEQFLRIAFREPSEVERQDVVSVLQGMLEFIKDSAFPRLEPFLR